MFYTLILENESGRQFNLSETANRIMFSKIEGLSPPAGTKGVVTNIINRLASGSTWMTLRTGENRLYLRASSGLTDLKVHLYTEMHI